MACLSGEEFEHAKNVLRIGVGAEVILLDNSGKEYTAVVSAVEKKQMLLNVVRESVGEREAKADTCLLFGYLKNADKNEFIVQKAVELGVKKIGVFSSQFSSAYMNANKLERLNKVSKEAAKQCLRSVAPKVEADLAKEKGYKLISLGKRILRAETAAVCLSSIVMYELGELE